MDFWMWHKEPVLDIHVKFHWNRMKSINNMCIYVKPIFSFA